MARFPLNLFVNRQGQPARLNARTNSQFERAARIIARRPGDTDEMIDEASHQQQLDADDLAWLVDVQKSVLRAATSSRRAAA